ncbi:MAG: hypothetical protein GXY82_09925 [Methanospirillum sp.]|nr:hypothetical protein [Methanospirillum sp.]
MPTDPAVRSQRRQTAVLAASAILAFVLTEYIAGPVLHLGGPWRYAAWFTIGLVLIVVFVTVFTLAAEALLGPAERIDE